MESDMGNYELADAADADLQEIAQYTISKWGAAQAVRYGEFLNAHFDAIGAGTVRTRIFLRHRPELRMSRVRHHYVFHIERAKKCPLILAVFHENMDLMARLRSRFAI